MIKHPHIYELNYILNKVYRYDPILGEFRYMWDEFPISIPLEHKGRLSCVLVYRDNRYHVIRYRGENVITLL